MTEAVEYLTKALELLREQRDDIDRQIKVLERTVAELTGKLVHVTGHDNGSGAESSTTIRPVRAVRPVRDIAIDVAKRGGVFTLEDVLKAVRDEGNDAQYASVSSILSRLRGEEVLVRGPRRGTYLLAPEKPKEPEAVTDAPTPQDPVVRPLVTAGFTGAAGEEGR